MTQTAINYANELFKTGITREILSDAKDILDAVPQIRLEFEDPTVELEKKHTVIEKVFPVEIRNFLKLLCDNGDFGLFDGIYQEYKNLGKTKETIETQADLYYVTPPTEKQLEGIRKFLAKQFNNEDIEIITIKDESLKSGFVLRIGNKEYDWSEKGRIEQLQKVVEKAVSEEKNSADADSISTENIISILRSNIYDFDLEAKDKEIGVVNWVGDGIANVDGIDHAFYGEIVVFDSGVKGMVQDVRKDEIGVILFGKDTEIKEGTKVVRTGKMAGISVGDNYLGRVIDALGNPIDGQGDIKADGFRPIECPAPSIVERKSVSVPMETGILSIDSMFPIGRGQRELIIGDRQTGKTSIASDTIINQKGKDVICIYVAVGQKASTVAKLVNSFKKSGAMDYTIVVSATAADPAPLQYIAPYSGTALAEYFMYRGKDVLIVYDDLSKHAVAYRAISLLLERSPGREAYPGDVFYQTKAMKKAAGSIRIDLAQYREMEVFTQFSSDLDDSTKKQLAHGKSLMELLKQPLGRPLSMAEQVITLVLANDHIFSDIDAAGVKKFQNEILDEFNNNHKDIISQLATTKELPDELKEQIIEAATDYKNDVMVSADTGAAESTDSQADGNNN